MLILDIVKIEKGSPMINAICKLYVRSFTWDSGVSFLPQIKEIVVIHNTVKSKSKRAKRRAIAKARAA